MKHLGRIVVAAVLLLAALAVWRAVTLSGRLSEAREATEAAQAAYETVKAENAALLADTVRFRASQDSLRAETDSILASVGSTADTVRILVSDTVVLRMVDTIEVRAERAVASERDRAERAEARVDSLVRQLMLTELRADSVIAGLEAEIEILEAPGLRLFGIPLACVAGGGGSAGVGGAAAGLSFTCGVKVGG